MVAETGAVVRNSPNAAAACLATKKLGVYFADGIGDAVSLQVFPLGNAERHEPRGKRAAGRRKSDG